MRRQQSRVLSSPSWKIKRERNRQSARFKFATAALTLLLLLGTVGILGSVPWANVGTSVKGVFTSSSNETLVPIPSSDPTFDLKQLLFERNIRTESDLKTESSVIVFTIEGGAQIFMSTQKNMASQVDSLQIILSRLTIEGKRFSKIDFRYDTPIVTY